MWLLLTEADRGATISVIYTLIVAGTMKTPTVIIENQKVKLPAADLIQAGGEGMVFAHGPDQVVKLYHQPLPLYQDKLSHLLRQNQLWPANVAGPQTAVFDEQNHIIGFTMARLPQLSEPFSMLTRLNYRRKMAISQSMVLTLLLDAHHTLSTLHQKQIVVGDLNEHNVFYTLASGTTNWIDADSYQIGRFPCPVALQSYLDPHLYSVPDFSATTAFTNETDWYAFFVLVTKCLLGVHPYGGTHKTHKSLEARARQRISVLNGAVIYPRQGLPVEALSDELLNLFQRVFEKGERPPLPAEALDEMRRNLQICAQCDLEFPRNRTMCPRCKQRSKVKQRVTKRQQSEVRLLLDTAGHIEAVWPSFEHKYSTNPNFRALVREDSVYLFLQGGVGRHIHQLPLFSGQPGYNFAYFDGHLVVNPPHQNQLLLLDVTGLEPARLGMLTTAMYRQDAAFATTPRHLYRIANGYILQGSVRDGQLLEEIVTTAYDGQTQLWGSPYNDMVAGLHRLMDSYTAFVRQADGQIREFELELENGESLQSIDIVFNMNGRHIDLFLSSHINGQTVYKSTVGVAAADIVRPQECAPFETAPVLIDDIVFLTSGSGLIKQKGFIETLWLDRIPDHGDQVDDINAGDRLHLHPRGVIIQKPHQLYLLEK